VPKLVRDEGSTSAPIVLIGEAPGDKEASTGRPFVGPSFARRLNPWWKEAGITRQDCYITNVCPRQPVRNDIDSVPPAELAAYVDRLHNTIASLKAPHVLVPTGNTALEALLGFRGITKHRGYFYSYKDRNGRELKVIPTIHPAATIYQGSTFQSSSDLEKRGKRSWSLRCIADWKRIAEEMRYPELNLPKREQYIRPTLDDVRWLHRQITALPKDAILALDVETPRRRIEVDTGDVFKSGARKGQPKTKKEWGDPYLACIGFSSDPAWAMTIPTTKAYWGSEKKWQEVRELLRGILMSRCQKATQNGLFDWFHCWLWLEVWPVNWLWDSLALHHDRDPVESHSLEFQASVFLRTTYWKDESKEADEITQTALQDIERFWAYNGKDAQHTQELITAHCSAPGFNRSRYTAFYQCLFLPLLDIMVRGIRVDEKRRRLRLAQLTAEAMTLRTRLTELAGEDLYGKTSISPMKLQKFLYETLHLPVQKKFDHKKKTRRATTDEVALRRLAMKYPKAFGEAGDCILGARRTTKKREFYDDSLLDPDGYTRCQYGFTETLRLKSWTNPMRRGRNHQNFDRECRDHLLPDEGHVWLEGDASQVEGRICYVMTGDPHLIELARRPPWEFDQHRYNASRAFGIPEELVTSEQRQVGKIAVHAAQRDMHGKTLADTLAKQLGLIRTPEECQKYIDDYFAAGHQPIKDVYFREVRHRMIHDRKLTNSWGFTMPFDNEDLTDDLYRRGYSFFMQSENGMNTNYLGLIPTWKWLIANRMRTRILQQGHDSLSFSAAPDECYDVMMQVQSTWEVEREYWGVALTIPICWKIGTAMGRTVAEFKKFPTRADVRKVIQECLP